MKKKNNRDASPGSKFRDLSPNSKDKMLREGNFDSLHAEEGEHSHSPEMPRWERPTGRQVD